MLPLIALAVALTQGTPAGDLTVRVDSARHVVLVEYRVPSISAARHGHHPGDRGHSAHVETLSRFAWPVDGWIRGARVEVIGADGARLAQRRLHHVNLINFHRRQLIHPGLERLWGAGQETDPVMLPAGVGVPVSSGTPLGLVAAWVPAELAGGSRILVAIRWSPSNTVPRPVDVLPVSFTVNFQEAATSAYDLPAGASEQVLEFVMPIGGRMLGVGGHLHDHGTAIRLEDAESGEIIVRLDAVRDSVGRLIRVPQRLFGISGRGKPLERGRRYRVVATYDNPTGATLVGGGMASLGVGFVPDRGERLPVADPRDPAVARDLAYLDAMERR